MAQYTEILNTLKPEQKIEFLEKVLKNSFELQSQFVNYFTTDQSAKIQQPVNFEQCVAEEEKEYKSTLEELDLENPDYDRWNDRNDRYYEQWEIEQEIIEDEVNELFDDFSAGIINSITLGDIELAMAQLTGLKIACETAEVDDSYDNLGGDPTDFFMESFERVVQDVKTEILKTIFNSDAVADSIINTVKYFSKNFSEETSTNGHDVLMMSLLQHNNKNCTRVYGVFDNHPESISLFPNTYLEAVKITHPDLWIQKAEKLCTENLQVAIGLLEYQSINDKEAFHRNAKELFRIFPRELVDVIAGSVDPSIDLEFAKEVLEFKTKCSLNIEDYKKMAKILTEAEKKDFTEQYAIVHYSFYVNILEVENQFEKILDFVRTKNIPLYQYPELMKPILNKFPTECYQILSPKIEVYLDTNINRGSYSQAASVLNFLASDIRNAEDVRRLALKFCTLYPRRSALKDELRQMNLISH